MADEIPPQKVISAGITSFSDHDAAPQQAVTGQSQPNVANIQGVHPAQSPPPQYYPPQHAPSNAYGVPGQHIPQIAEFAVPVDPYRSAPNTQVIISQPQMMVQPAPTVYVPDEMGFSIFTTLCCCLYLGIPAMIFASQANGLRHVDPERALAKAKVARALNITAVVLGIISITVVLILQFAVLNSNPGN